MDGATVTISQAGAAAPAAQPPSGADGKVTYGTLQPGTWTISVSKPGFDNPPPPITGDVTAHNTTKVDVVLTRQGLECQRKHAATPTGGVGGQTLAPMFWADEPWILVLRDVLFMLSLVGTVIGVIWMFLDKPPGGDLSVGGAAMTAICLAITGYLGNVIFGMPFGIPAIIIAFLAYLALIVAAIVRAVQGAAFSMFGNQPPIDYWGFPILCGIWAAFAYGIMGGRRENWDKDHLGGPVIAPMILAFVTTLAVFIFFAAIQPHNPFEVGHYFAAVGVVLLGTLLGTVAGLLGYAFVNDGKTQLAFMDAATTGYAAWEDFLLPYKGQRYCVQGHRGFISHFGRQEASYDFSLPEGEPVLSAKEGHIVAYDESREGNVRSNGNETPNYVAVRHKDGTIAMYLHCQKDSVTAINPKIAQCVTSHPEEGNFTGTGDAERNPLHVYAGQQIAGNGDVGISMFPHIHFFIKIRAGGPYMPFKFKDADVQSHGGQCYSMRKYQSSNANNGPVQVPPPGAAGGPA